MKQVFFSVVLILLMSNSGQAQGWRGLVTVRSDCELLRGLLKVDQCTSGTHRIGEDNTSYGPASKELALKCNNDTDQEISLPKGAIKFDQFGFLEKSKEEQRLSNFANLLNGWKEMTGYIVGYTGKVGEEGLVRACRMKDFLTKSGVSQDRLIVLTGAPREESTVELWLITWANLTGDAIAAPTSSPQVVSTPAMGEQSHPVADSQQMKSAGSPVFASVLTELQSKSRVPLRLPTYLANEEETSPLFAIVETAAPTRYEVQLAFTKNCTGGNACRYGRVSGQAIGKAAKQERGQAVSLTQGITGYFVNAKCGANCSDSTLTWIQEGYRYTVGIKAEHVETLTKVANSAIK